MNLEVDAKKDGKYLYIIFTDGDTGNEIRTVLADAQGWWELFNSPEYLQRFNGKPADKTV